MTRKNADPLIETTCVEIHDPRVYSTQGVQPMQMVGRPIGGTPPTQELPSAPPPPKE